MLRAFTALAIALFANHLTPHFAFAQASDLTLQKVPAPPPDLPGSSFDEMRRLAAAVGLRYLGPMEREKPGSEVRGNTPRWQKFVAATERRSGTSRWNMLEAVVSAIGLPDFSETMCHPTVNFGDGPANLTKKVYLEEQCDAVAKGADGWRPGQPLGYSYTFVWFNGPCQPVVLVLVPGNSGRFGEGDVWSALGPPRWPDYVRCVQGGTSFPSIFYKSDYFSCRLRPGRVGCDRARLTPPK